MGVGIIEEPDKEVILFTLLLYSVYLQRQARIQLTLMHEGSLSVKHEDSLSVMHEGNLSSNVQTREDDKELVCLIR